LVSRRIPEILDVLAGVLALPALGALVFLVVTLPQYGVVGNEVPETLLAVILSTVVFGWLGIRYLAATRR
jgi:hypothetical protein